MGIAKNLCRRWRAKERVPLRGLNEKGKVATQYLRTETNGCNKALNDYTRKQKNTWNLLKKDI